MGAVKVGWSFNGRLARSTEWVNGRAKTNRAIAGVELFVLGHPLQQLLSYIFPPKTH